MPIKPENRQRYPADWPAIRARILERAGSRCEGSPCYPDCRAAPGKPPPVTGSRVVLTLAHWDHCPETREESLRRTWCQRCHNAYAQPQRQRHAAQTRQGSGRQALICKTSHLI